MTTTPDGLIEGAEAAASAWRLDRSRLLEAEEKVLALEGWREALEQDLTAAVARGEVLAANLAAKVARLAEAQAQVAGLQAEVEELRTKLAECKHPEEPPPVPEGRIRS